MKLIDAILRVKRPVPANKWQFSSPVEEIAEALSVSPPWNYDELDERLRSYPIFSWLCTDEMVGLYAIYLDDEPVGASYRSGRKMGYTFMWLSQEIAEKVRSFLLSYGDTASFNLLDPALDINAFAYHGETDGVINVEPE